MKINDGANNKPNKELQPVSGDKLLRSKQNFQIFLEFSDKLITMDFSHN